MTSLQRVQCAINHEQPDRVPVDLRFSDETWVMLKEYLSLGDDALWEWIGQDVVTVRPVFTRAVTTVRYADPTVIIDENGYYLDIYRVPFRKVKTTYQEYLEMVSLPPLADYETAQNLDSFPWPTTEGWDYSGIPALIDCVRGKAVWARSRGCFQVAQMMRGMDTFLVDLATEPAFACAILEHISHFVEQDAKLTLESSNGKYTFIEYNDDVATQRGMLISPEMWRKYLKPIMKRFCDMVHSFGANVKYHSCGSIYDIIPDLIEIGVDILNPIQPLAANMDPFRIKKEFGNDICLHGGVDIQRLLPEATVNQVRGHVRKMIDLLGCGGGYILAGSHTIQSDAKAENIVAVIQAISA